MKKLLFSILSLCMIFLLSACGEPPTVRSDFTAAFRVCDSDVDYAGTLQKEGDNLTVTLTSPYTVEGMCFIYQDGTLSIRRAGHETNANTDYLPAKSVPSALHHTLAYLSQATYTDTQNDEDHFILPTPYGDAAITAKAGIPTTLTDPYSGMEFCFSQ